MRNLRLLYILVRAGAQNRWRESSLGPCWVIINPIVTLSVHWFVFKHFFSQGSYDYFSYLIAGFLPWLFMKGALDIGVSTLPFKLQALKNCSASSFLYNTAGVCEYFLHLPLCYIILSIISYQIGEGSMNLSFFIYSLPSLIILMISTITLVHIFSLCHTIYRDTKYILDFLLRFVLLLTPIFYYPDQIKSLRQFLKYNPFYYLIKPFHLALNNDYSGWIDALLQSSVVMTFLILICFTVNFFYEEEVFCRVS